MEMEKVPRKSGKKRREGKREGKGKKKSLQL